MVNLTFKQLVEVEQLRSIEETCGAMPDLAKDKNSEHNFFSWLVYRVEQCKADDTNLSALTHGPLIYKASLLLCMLLMALLGGSATSQALEVNAGHTLNIFWIVGILLGFNWLSLLLWILVAVFSGGQPRGVIGNIFSIVQRRLLLRDSKTKVYAASKAWLSLYFAPSIARWRLSCISHTAWLLYLCGGCCCLLLLLATQKFDFIWSSTLLGGEFFVGLTQVLAAPLNVLNIPTPSVEQILWSQEASNLVGSAETRQAWAYFLLGSILIYGLLPRAVVCLFCFYLQKRAEFNTDFDGASPYYIQLRYRFEPSKQSRIVDPDVFDKDKTGVSQKLKYHRFSSDAHWLGLELGKAWVWPKSVDAASVIGVARGESHLIELLENASSYSQLLLVVLVKAEKAPDRGFQRMLKDIVAQLTSANIWLALAVSSDDLPLAKVEAWVMVGMEAGIGTEQICLVESAV